jgi:hypothetical protein
MRSTPPGTLPDFCSSTAATLSMPSRQESLASAFAGSSSEHSARARDCFRRQAVPRSCTFVLRRRLGGARCRSGGLRSSPLSRALFGGAAGPGALRRRPQCFVPETADPAAVGRCRPNGISRALIRGSNPRGWKADVAYVPSRENRSHGSTLGGKQRDTATAPASATRSGRPLSCSTRDWPQRAGCRARTQSLSTVVSSGRLATIKLGILRTSVRWE